MHVDPDFRPHLAAMDLEQLDRDPGTVFGIWPDGRLAFTNRGWRLFALENGSPHVLERWQLGADVYAAIPEVLRPFYRRAWDRVLRTGRPWNHRYECSSPDWHRDLHMVAHSLNGGAGLLVTNSVVVERPHDPAVRTPHAAMDGEYRTAAGWIVQCAECRRVRSRLEIWRWDWVPQWVGSPPPPALGALCELCFDRYYAVRQ